VSEDAAVMETREDPVKYGYEAMIVVLINMTLLEDATEISIERESKSVTL